VAACESLTVKPSCEVPLLPSVIEASPIESVGRTGGGGGVTAAPSMTRPVAAVPPAPGVAWKPKLAYPPAGTVEFQSTLRIT
jgi:hypothetical protein